MNDYEKVGILSSTDAAELENAINEFIAGKNLIDIKYSPVVIKDYPVTAINETQKMIVDRVLIIYEDQEDI